MRRRCAHTLKRGARQKTPDYQTNPMGNYANACRERNCIKPPPEKRTRFQRFDLSAFPAVPPCLCGFVSPGRCHHLTLREKSVLAKRTHLTPTLYRLKSRRRAACERRPSPRPSPWDGEGNGSGVEKFKGLRGEKSQDGRGARTEVLGNPPQADSPSGRGYALVPTRGSGCPRACAARL